MRVQWVRAGPAAGRRPGLLERLVSPAMMDSAICSGVSAAEVEADRAVQAFPMVFRSSEKSVVADFGQQPLGACFGSKLADVRTTPQP